MLEAKSDLYTLLFGFKKKKEKNKKELHSA